MNGVPGAGCRVPSAVQGAGYSVPHSSGAGCTRHRTRHPGPGTRHWLLGLGSFLVLLLLAAACSTAHSASRQARAPRDLRATAARMYRAYGEALTTPRPEALSGFYHPEGALIVLNGIAARPTRQQIDTRYRTAWTAPAFFAWDSLAYDSIAPGQVMVTGNLRWQSRGQRDTSRVIYAALLVAVDTGLAIRFEHETIVPAR